MPIDPTTFAAELCTFFEYMRAQAPSRPSPLRDAILQVFDAEASSLALVSESLPPYDLPNLQVALDQVLARGDVKATSIGIVPDMGSMFSDLGNLVLSPPDQPDHSPPREGPMTYLNVELANGRVLPCVQLGMFIVRTPNSACVYFVTAQIDGVRDKLSVQVLARHRDEAQAAMADFKKTMGELDVYRGQVLMVEEGLMSGVKIRFANLETVAREDVILQPGVLDRIERETTGFSEHGAKLHESGFHLKRGTLLYGPPGNGKTLTTRYLAGAVRDRTVLLLTGEHFSSLAEACKVAHRLQPSMVIMDDVDLIAEDRSAGGACAKLHELMNAMDGLSGDADIQFVLTTNRADILEPALASRPGRIDLSVEIPLPDAACRERLFRLNCASVEHDGVDIGDWVERTDGASATYIRELVRRAALQSLIEGGSVCLQQRHVEAASRELIDVGGELNRQLLGFKAVEEAR